MITTTWNNVIQRLCEGMSSRQYPTTPLLGACTAVWRGDQVLLARRGRAPNEGTWGMPGGLAEVGETLDEAAIREVEEETQLRLERVIFNRFHEIIRRDSDGAVERHYVLAMFVGHSDAGLAVAGDDAEAVRWFALADLKKFPLTDQTEEFVRESLIFLPKLT